MRGAYLFRNGNRSAPAGEPPRARGLRHAGAHGLPAARRTPACAGPTAGVVAGACVRGENPRVRGAYPAVDADQTPKWGEPPRARGLPLRPSPWRRGKRRTPACAGPTAVQDRPAIRRPENPRVRGAYEKAPSSRRPTSGEPPRARGLPQHNQGGAIGRGRTPACAGPTTYARHTRALNRENPRVRGAYRRSR